MVVILRKITFYLLFMTVFTVPWERAFIIPGIGSFNKLSGIGLVIMAIYSVIIRKKVKKLPIFYYLVLAFIILNVASFFISSNTNNSIEKIFLFMQLGFLAWVIFEFVPDQKSIDKLLKAFVFGTLIIAVQSFLVYLNGSSQTLGTRITIEGYNYNSISTIMTLSLPITIYLALKGSKLILIYIPFAVFSILLTGSRMAFILLLFVGISFIWLLFMRKTKLRKTILLASIMLVILIFNQIPEAQLERLGTIDEELSSGEIGGRGDIWRGGFITFTQNPILGVGAGGFQKEVVKNSISNIESSAHNSYLSILVEYGLVGFVLFFSMILILLIAALKIDDKYTKWLFVTIMIFWLIDSISSHSADQKYSWIMFGLIITANRISKKTKKSKSMSYLKNSL